MATVDGITRRRFCASVASFALLLPLAACGGPAAASPIASAPASSATSAPKDVVKVGAVLSITDAAFYIGMAKGWYADAGIDLQLTNFANAAEEIAPLGQGQLDVGGGAPSSGMNNAVGRDIGIRIVADRGFVPSDSSAIAIMVRKDVAEKVKSFADLKGLKFAIPGGGAALLVTVDRGMRSVGLTVKDLDLVNMPFADMVAAFAGGKVDAAAIVEPFATQAAAKGLAEVFKRSNEFNPNNQSAVLLYGPKFVQDRPDVARRFMTAYLRSIRLYNDAFFKQPRNQAAYDEVVGILTKETTVKDPALYSQMQMPTIHPDGKIQIQSLKDDQEWYLQNGYQKTRIDLETAVDTTYVDYAVKQLGGPYKP